MHNNFCLKWQHKHDIVQVTSLHLIITHHRLCWLADIIRSDIALDKQKGCKLANHPDMMLELQREKAASTQLVLLKEQLSNIYSNITITGRRTHTQKHTRERILNAVS